VWKREAWKFDTHRVLLRPDFTMESMNNIGGDFTMKVVPFAICFMIETSSLRLNSRLWSVDCKSTMTMSLFPKAQRSL
jgi:hypothetical protein